jgi:hybrid cluster-associated redox disulfide protein
LRLRKDITAILRDPCTMTPADVLVLFVADVLAMSSGAARVFVDKGMGCVGCPFSRFETVADVARNYGVDPVQLAVALLEAVCVDVTQGALS